MSRLTAFVVGFLAAPVMFFVVHGAVWLATLLDAVVGPGWAQMLFISLLTGTVFASITK